jgi:hypothetical protein
MENKEQNTDSIEDESNLSELEQALLGLILNLRHETDYLPDHYYEWMDKLIHKADCKDEASQPINSGWVSVETIEDLPIEDCRYWIANKNGVFDFLANKEQVKAKFSNGTLTHYKKVDEPSPPKP